jgi:hypothetical protein
MAVNTALPCTTVCLICRDSTMLRMVILYLYVCYWRGLRAALLKNEVITVVTSKTAIFWQVQQTLIKCLTWMQQKLLWDVTPWGLVQVYQRLRRTFCLCHQAAHSSETLVTSTRLHGVTSEQGPLCLLLYENNAVLEKATKMPTHFMLRNSDAGNTIRFLSVHINFNKTFSWISSLTRIHYSSFHLKKKKINSMMHESPVARHTGD